MELFIHIWQIMEKFKYKLNSKIYILFVIGAILSTICFVWNIIRLVNYIQANTIEPYAVISVSLAILMSIAFIVIMTSIVASSWYIFEKNIFITKLGILKTTTEYKKIKQIVWFKEENKLTIFHTDETFTNILINDNEYQSFVNVLIEHNKNIVYYEDINSKKN